MRNTHHSLTACHNSWAPGSLQGHPHRSSTPRLDTRKGPQDPTRPGSLSLGTDFKQQSCPFRHMLAPTWLQPASHLDQSSGLSLACCDPAGDSTQHPARPGSSRRSVSPLGQTPDLPRSPGDGAPGMATCPSNLQVLCLEPTWLEATQGPGRQVRPHVTETKEEDVEGITSAAAGCC